MTRMAAQSEAAFQTQVINMATYYGWKHYHAPDNRPGRNGRVQRVTAGFPDLILLRGTDALAVELKTEKGRVQPEQAEWLCALELAGFETYVWRPSDFDDAHQRLAQGRHQSQPIYRTASA